MKPLIPLLFLLAFLLLATAGCIQPPAEPNPANETGFNISAVERDPVREAAAEKIQFPKNVSELDDLEWRLPENQAYYQYMNETPNGDYYGFLVSYYQIEYRSYCKHNLSLTMSFIEYLERYLTNYVYDLNHDTNYRPLWFLPTTEEYMKEHRVPSHSVLHLTEEIASATPLFKSCFIDTPGGGVKVLPEEEWQLLPYKNASYLEWKGDYYIIMRSIS